MAARGRLIVMGLAVAIAVAVIWAFLQTTGSERAAPAIAPGDNASPAASPVPVPSPRVGQLPAVAVDRTKVTTVDAQGRRQWEIRAETVLVDGATNKAVLRGIQGTYFQRGPPAVSFSAQRGTFDAATHIVALTGAVRARAPGRSVQADAVEWSPKTQKVIATGDVVLRQKVLILRADRLTADTTLQRANLQGNIRVTIEE
jgi:LPS export ABC transporter protein LptC